MNLLLALPSLTHCELQLYPSMNKPTTTISLAPSLNEPITYYSFLRQTQ
ncbi:hypothetical protein GYH30_009012 [Glycine max]|uniref:Uncharacterized protein n=1 Tax=Glycine max TaxID=3847 RepID=A0A0R0K8B4_SOYBN|nr:hypothetical protein GYH30_009012 [Glycine max]